MICTSKCVRVVWVSYFYHLLVRDVTWHDHFYTFHPSVCMNSKALTWPRSKSERKSSFSPFLVTLCSGIVFALFQILSRNGFLRSIVEEGHKRRRTAGRYKCAIWGASPRTFKFWGRYARRISMKIRLFHSTRVVILLNYIFQFLPAGDETFLTCWAGVRSYR